MSGIKVTFFVILVCIFYSVNLSAQELFPLTEPASTMPKNVLSPRVFSSFYNEAGTYRTMASAGFYYGATPYLTFRVSGVMSNHHDRTLPLDFITHTHYGNQTIFYTQNRNQGDRYPFLFNGVNIYAKYRVFSMDKPHEHLRFAAYGEYSTSKTAHDEAEPNLFDDNSGYGFGFIMTRLKNRFAYSVTLGYAVPDPYEEFGEYSHRYLQYGNAVNYSLSFGYLLSPKEYTSYAQANTNIYLEMIGRWYGELIVYEDGLLIEEKNCPSPG